MATKLAKPVTRALKVKDANNNEGEICVTMTGDGIQFWKGRRKLNVIPWAEIGKLSTLPPNGPAKFAGDNLGWLVELSKDKEIWIEFGIQSFFDETLIDINRGDTASNMRYWINRSKRLFQFCSGKKITSGRPDGIDKR